MEPVKKLPDSEMKLMELIWDSEPVRSGELVSMSLEKHGWKKSTVYTILKKLVNKGFAINEDSVITSTRPREEVLSDPLRGGDRAELRRFAADVPDGVPEPGEADEKGSGGA